MRTASYEHLDALALGELARDALRSGGAGSIAGERAHLDVVVTLHELRTGLGFGELAAGAAGNLPIDIDALRRIACDADLRRVVTSVRHADPHTGRPIDPVVARLLHAPSEVLDYGRSQRIVPTGLRRRQACPPNIRHPGAWHGRSIIRRRKDRAESRRSTAGGPNG